ncbi:MAG: hypothetical protein K5798_09270 [Nitrosopumilus sp.]|uniref:Uncharacterized protein n=1 Tax=Nitrosopumilus zosterae TaxID=718286 RepID=A0A2S2KNQ9_9ARCH|nr:MULTISPECIES: hypothetical protein [Nitrosopumilus]MCV0367432.1 hypothetical protein [Nitrosopumilus sp.]BDQ31045.1 hypothetical protein NZOSNM25_001155 [Nitrosopumilus zosterae]GBH33256.1 hypothetical protein NZNM25_00470 [Nitrosopumilus zosterae]
MKQYTVIIAVGIGGIGIMMLIFGMDILKLSVSTQDYDIFVDPILDKQSMFVMGRVTIQNTGYLPLTNVHVNFGAGDTLELGTINVGEKIIVSPPSDNPMEFVMISADNDIFVNKVYREMPKMVGMMGS